MSRLKRYVEGEKEYILELREKGLKYTDIAKEVNRAFGNNRSHNAVAGVIRNAGKSKTLNQYTKEELDFIREKVKDHTIKEVAELITKEFGIERTESGVRSVMTKVGIKTGRTGLFGSGHIPGNCRKLFHERIDKQGYITIKVEEPNVWELKHRWVYEQHYNVKLEEDDLIIFKDGDKANTNIDNLVKIDRNEHLRLNRQGLRSEHPELTETGLQLTRLMIAISDKKKGEINW